MLMVRAAFTRQGLGCFKKCIKVHGVHFRTKCIDEQSWASARSNISLTKKKRLHCIIRRRDQRSAKVTWDVLQQVYWLQALERTSNKPKPDIVLVVRWTEKRYDYLRLKMFSRTTSSTLEKWSLFHAKNLQRGLRSCIPRMPSAVDFWPGCLHLIIALSTSKTLLLSFSSFFGS